MGGAMLSERDRLAGEKEELVLLAKHALSQAWLSGVKRPLEDGLEFPTLAKELDIEVARLREAANAFGDDRFLALAFSGPLDGVQKVRDLFDNGMICGPGTNTCGTCACGTASCGTCHCGTGTCGSCLC